MYTRIWGPTGMEPVGGKPPAYDDEMVRLKAREDFKIRRRRQAFLIGCLPFLALLGILLFIASLSRDDTNLDAWLMSQEIVKRELSGALAKSAWVDFPSYASGGVKHLATGTYLIDHYFDLRDFHDRDKRIRQPFLCEMRYIGEELLEGERPGFFLAEKITSGMRVRFNCSASSSGRFMRCQAWELRKLVIAGSSRF